MKYIKLGMCWIIIYRQEVKHQGDYDLVVCGDFNGDSECAAVHYLESGIVELSNNLIELLTRAYQSYATYHDNDGSSSKVMSCSDIVMSRMVHLLQINILQKYWSCQKE